VRESLSKAAEEAEDPGMKVGLVGFDNPDHRVKVQYFAKIWRCGATGSMDLSMRTTPRSKPARRERRARGWPHRLLFQVASSVTWVS
jgi:hypothetical protein